MTKSISKTLISHKTIDQIDLSQNLVSNFLKESNRGYGEDVSLVFQKMRKNKFQDILGPAMDQFEGKYTINLTFFFLLKWISTRNWFFW